MACISNQISSIFEVNVPRSVPGKLIVVSRVLNSLATVPDMVVEEFDRGAAIETVLHLPEGVNKDSARGVARIVSDTTGLYTKSNAYQESQTIQNVLLRYN